MKVTDISNFQRWFIIYCIINGKIQNNNLQCFGFKPMYAPRLYILPLLILRSHIQPSITSQKFVLFSSHTILQLFYSIVLGLI